MLVCDRRKSDVVALRPNVRAKVAPTVWRAGTAAQNWGEAPAPQAQCATPLGLSLSEGLGITTVTNVHVWCFHFGRQKFELMHPHDQYALKDRNKYLEKHTHFDWSRTERTFQLELKAR
jgi:hypothetical protein